jgi:hypothetical protein
MQEVELLFELVEGRFDEGGVWEGKVSCEGREIADQQVQRLPHYQSFGYVLHPIAFAVEVLHFLAHSRHFVPQSADFILVAVIASLNFDPLAIIMYMLLQIFEFRHAPPAKSALDGILGAGVDVCVVVARKDLIFAASARSH